MGTFDSANTSNPKWIRKFSPKLGSTSIFLLWCKALLLTIPVLVVNKPTSNIDNDNDALYPTTYTYTYTYTYTSILYLHGKQSPRTPQPSSSQPHKTSSKMGRSAKMMKRQTIKQKAVSKMAKAASKPVPVPVVEKVEEAAAVEGGKKKRKNMRAKADKVGF
jgi:hypothetical protein